MAEERVEVLGWEGRNLHVKRADGREVVLTDCKVLSMDGLDVSSTEDPQTVEMTISFEFHKFLQTQKPPGT